MSGDEQLPSPPVRGLAHDADDLPDVAYAVALAGLRDMTPARLRLLLDGHRAAEVYAQLVAGDPALVESLARLGAARRGAAADEQLDVEKSWGTTGSIGSMERARGQARDWLRSWRRELERTPTTRRWRSLQASGIGVVRRGDPAYPARLLRARQVPELLYLKGRLDQVAAPCVAIVGTRRATHYGREMAAALGRELAERGVVVVSGLARGIDGAAHSGAIAAGRRPNGPLAVVGGGVDVVYPREHQRLWDEVVAAGGIVSEAPPGAPPESWRFPLRNRIIAALSQVLVVVESSRQGGAMHTVLAADSYGVPVLAVPGSVRSPQSEGTNAIIQEGGAGVALDVHDVLAVLALVCEEDGTPASFSPAGPGSDPRQPVNAAWRSGWGRSAGATAESPHTSPRPPDRGRALAAQQSLDLGPVPPLPPASPAAGPPLHRPQAPSGSTRDLAVARCTPTERAVLEAVDDTPTLVELVCLRTQLDLGVVALAVDRLEELGLLRSDGAAWIRL